MKFSYLENAYRTWDDILVIGKTIERGNKKYHIIGMTLYSEAKLYIIEPYTEPENCIPGKKVIRNQKKFWKKTAKVKEVKILICIAVTSA